jgi:WXG100 family type VII secretion target
MSTAAQQVEEALSSIRGQQSQLANYNSELIGSWKGEAATAFANAYTQFNEDFTIVVNALNGILERLGASHANYNTVEAANQETANRISTALNR